MFLSISFKELNSWLFNKMLSLICSTLCGGAFGRCRSIVAFSPALPGPFEFFLICSNVFRRFTIGVLVLC